MHGQKAADIRQLQEVPGATEAVLPQTGIQRQHGQIYLPAPERFRIPPEVRFHVPVPDGVLALPVPPVQIPGMKDRPAFRRHQKGHALTVPKTIKLDGKMAKRILGIGIPSAFENSLFEAGRILVVSMISTFGTVQIAANAVANNLDGMGVIPGKALSLAMITVVGRCIGARDDEQAVYYTRKLTVWSYIAMGLSNGAILLFLHKLIGIYALSGETMVLSELLVRIHAGFAILLWTLSFVLPNALRAANDVKFTMIVSILSMAVWRLGFSYLLCVRMGWGAVGVWIAMIIDWVCRVTCFVLRFRSGVWKTKYQA